MWLVSDQGRVVVFVWDASPQPPAQAADPGADAEGGRGLHVLGGDQRALPVGDAVP